MVLHTVPRLEGIRPGLRGPFRYEDGSYGYETESKEFMFPVSESENHVIPAFLKMLFEQ